jgi:hypothetical protein
VRLAHNGGPDPVPKPMKISMHQASVPTISRALTNLVGVLEKAAQSCEARKIDPAVLVQSRLAPDMFPLVKQVQIATDVAKAACSRLAQQEPPAYEDSEKTIPELVERLRKTIALIEALPAAKFEGVEDRTITWKAGENTRSMQGVPYLFHHALPNVFFHCTTAYDILRHNGVDIGKRDYLGKL